MNVACTELVQIELTKLTEWCASTLSPELFLLHSSKRPSDDVPLVNFIFDYFNSRYNNGQLVSILNCIVSELTLCQNNWNVRNDVTNHITLASVFKDWTNVQISMGTSRRKDKDQTEISFYQHSSSCVHTESPCSKVLRAWLRTVRISI